MDRARGPDVVSRPGRVDGATAEWRHIARNRNVLYSIAGDPARREPGWTPAEFYAAGSSDWADFERHWRHYDPELGGSCVEIGCGAGRLTQALSASFERVVALDVSEQMLAMARDASPENVEFHRVDGPSIPLRDGEVDAVFSAHVLQHLETAEVMRAYLADAHRVLRADGTMMIHLTLTSRRPSRVWRIKEEILLRWSRRRLERGAGHTAVRMRVYRPEDVFAMLAALGFDAIELRAFATRSNGYLHHFFLARR